MRDGSTIPRPAGRAIPLNRGGPRPGGPTGDSGGGARRPTPWPAGRVTALGDAVHAMPPTGGQGAATAIHDADRLAAHLAGVRAGRTALATAVADFHRDMAGYAPAAVAESLRPVRWIRALGGPTTTVLARAALPAVAAAAAAARAARRTGRGSPFPREAT